MFVDILYPNVIFCDIILHSQLSKAHASEKKILKNMVSYCNIVGNCCGLRDVLRGRDLHIILYDAARLSM